MAWGVVTIIYLLKHFLGCACANMLPFVYGLVIGAHFHGKLQDVDTFWYIPRPNRLQLAYPSVYALCFQSKLRPGTWESKSFIVNSILRSTSSEYIDRVPYIGKDVSFLICNYAMIEDDM